MQVRLGPMEWAMISPIKQPWHIKLEGQNHVQALDLQEKQAIRTAVESTCQMRSESKRLPVHPLEFW